MDNKEHYEQDCEAIINWRGRTDYARLRIGLRISRMDKRYGAGTVEDTARRCQMGKSTLYEYQQVWNLLWQWRGYSARRTFEDYPTLTHKHLRKAVTLPFEDAIEAIEAIDLGDPRFDTVLPMTPDAFDKYVDFLRGKESPKPALFDISGYAHEVLTMLKMRAPDFLTKKVRVVVREVEE